MDGVLSDVGMVVLFILVGGFFAASEIALVSLRSTQLERLAERGAAGARAGRLAADANRFLSTVQIGVTLAGFFSASYGAVTLAPYLAPVLVDWGLGQEAADTVAFIVITVAIAYLSLVFGELAPKRLALQRPEGLSLVVAIPLDLLATVLRPVIWLLSRSTDVVVRLLGGDPTAQREEISEEELAVLLRGHQSLTVHERRILGDVLEAGDRHVREVMLPRTEVEFLRADLPLAEAVETCRGRPYSRYPVIGTTPDDVRGFVHVRDLFDPATTAGAQVVGDVVREVPLLPESMHALVALARMRASGTHLAVVVDEYGGTAGIVTLEDLIEELVGDIRDEYDLVPEVPPPAPVGARTLDGLTRVDEVHETVPGLRLPDGDYDTVGGFVMDRLGRVPRLGDRVTADGHELEVVEMDGYRVARVLVRPVSRPD